MHINVGDFVECRRDKKMGMVVEKNHANPDRKIFYPYVYYVYVPHEGKLGPYFGSEIILHQRCQGSTTVNMDL